MRAAVVAELNGPDGVEIRELADPSPGPGQVLIDVEYTGISSPTFCRRAADTRCDQNCPSHRVGR